MDNENYYPNTPVIELDENSRGQFIGRTYNHLLGAIVAFTLIEVVLFKTGLADPIAEFMLSTNWLLILGAFLVVSWLARGAAQRATSMATQYAALAGYVVGQSLIFVPMLYLANHFAPGAIASAALVTLMGFVGLTAVVFITRKDFSFLRGIVMWGGIVAVVLIIGGVSFGFQLGTYFSVAMVALAGAAILYDTDNILRNYPSDRYVAASLELFADVALMLWYVLRLFMSRR
ncbi:MAG TPA: Bax inhibitor-1 family protein [Candidatus Acidoferrales bacterium]|jgi:FtsH-binding integral membrane protein|nr:Bax inhibitor-1 family protein [Candidatus Acidoferrales bacterium]